MCATLSVPSCFSSSVLFSSSASQSSSLTDTLRRDPFDPFDVTLDLSDSAPLSKMNPSGISVGGIRCDT